jgi:hypothetical protein
MAITDVNLIWQDEGVTENDQGVKEFRQQWRCISNSGTTDNVITAISDPRLPQAGNVLTGTSLTVRSRECRRESDEDRELYLVTVTYSNSANTGGEVPGGPPQPNPMDDGLVIRYSSGRSSKPVDRDLDGKLVANTAGDVFDPLPEKRIAAPTLTITKNFANFSFREALDWVMTTNETDFQGAEKDRLLLTEINGEGPKYRNDIEFFSMSFVFEYNADEADPNGWQPSLLNLGFNELVDSGNGGFKVPQRIKIGGEDSPIPQLLDRDGKAIDPATVAAGTASAVFKDFRFYNRKDFNQLGLF